MSDANDVVPERNNAFDEIVDVIVVGCGFAGANAAIAAIDAGRSVIVLEKMPDPGGISICSGGGIRIARDAEMAFAYLTRTNGNTAPDEVLRALAEGMTRIDQRVHELAAASKANVVYRDAPGIYPFEGRDTFRFVTVDAIPGFDAATGFPHANSLGTGALLIKVLLDNLALRGADLRLNSPVRRLVQADDAGANRVLGVVVGDQENYRRLGARHGVVLACGGFEACPQMQRQYWQGAPVFSTSFLGNTGDGIRMAQSAGADLWHMWHYHGTYGFKTDDAPIGVRTKRLPDWYPGADGAEANAADLTQGSPSDLLAANRAVPMPWILLDKDGRRFTNEYEPYMQDTGHRALDRYEPERQRFARIPAWLIADQDGFEQFRWGQPIYNDRQLALEWSDDNEAEVQSGLIQRAGSIGQLAEKIDVSESQLSRSIADWNRFCALQSDEDYNRPAASMMPIQRTPLYAAPIWPLVSNTQGGPVHDSRQRVLDPYGQPIAGLYAAGELGSVFGHLYLSGGNLAECFIGGEIAGKEAAATVPIDLGA